MLKSRNDSKEKLKNEFSATAIFGDTSLFWHLKQQAYPRVGVLLEEVQYKKYENIDYEPDTKDIMIH